MKRIFLLLVIPIFLAGCMATGPAFTEAPSPTGDNAIIYVYRIANVGGSARDPHFYVNSKMVFKLGAGGYSYFVVPAGSYELVQGWAVDLIERKTLKVRFKAKPRESHYFRFDADVVPGPGNNEYDLHWQLVEVSPSLGRTEISDKVFQEQDIVNPITP